MKVENDFVKVISNVDLKKGMRFGIADMSIVMELLTKLYQNPKRTLTQEYISNARDANREVNSKTPIKIVAPNRLNPVFSVRDYGPGLTPERINEVFLFYGASTKNQDNTQTGGFGIGAKSAWAYTDSFNITTFVNGTKRSYVAHKSSGNGNLDLVSEVPTLEPNGTEVSIAVAPRDIDAFRAAAARTVYFWDKHEQPTMIGFEGFNFCPDDEKININFWVSKEGIPGFIFQDVYNLVNSVSRINLLVVDGIPYLLTGNLMGISNSVGAKIKLPFYLRINTGDIKIAPTRENIVDDANNVDRLKKFYNQALSDVIKFIEKELASIKTTHDKIQKFIELYKTYSVDSTFEGYYIRNNVLYSKKFEKKPWKTICLNWNNDKVKSDLATGVPLDFSTRVFYYDIKEPAGKRDHRFRRLIANLKVNSHDRSVYLLIPPPLKVKEDDSFDNYIDEATYKEIIKDLNIRSTEHIDVSDWVTPPKAVKSAPKATFCLHVFDGYNLNSEWLPLDTTQDILYDVKDEGNYNRRWNYDFKGLIGYAKSVGFKYGYVAKSTAEKIKTNKKIVKLEDWIKNHIPSEDNTRMTLLGNNIANYNRFNYLVNYKDLVEDENLAFILRNFSGKALNGVHVPNEFAEAMKKTKFYSEFKNFLNNSKGIIEGIYKKYPLLAALPQGSLCEENKEHMVKYINMINRGE